MVGVLLMNKLFLERRYDDVIKVYQRLVAIDSSLSTNKNCTEVYMDALIEKVYYNNHYNLFNQLFANLLISIRFEHFLLKNDQSSFKLAQELYTVIQNEPPSSKTVRFFKKMFLIATNQVK